MPLLPPLQADAPARRGPATVPAASGRRAGDPFLVRVALLVTAIAVVLDQATKELAVRALARGRMMDLLGDGWGLQLTYNSGGAWGFGAPYWFFLVVTVVVIVIVVRNLPRAQTLPTATAYALLMAGALGNALDRIMRVGDPGDPRFLHGHVVDFLAMELPFYGAFPRFNLADVTITSGFVLLLLAMWHEERSAAAATAPSAGEGHPTPTAPARS